MAKGINYFVELAKKMVDDDAERDAAFVYYEKLYHGEWELPDKIKELGWVRAVKSTDPHDSVETGRRILSGLNPRVKWQPLDESETSRRFANHMEKILKWHLKAANSRRSKRVEGEIVQSALLYDAVAANIIDMDWHIRIVKERGGDTKALERWRRMGRFVINVYNPRNVHVRRNSFGLESVLLRQIRPAGDVVKEWSSSSKKLNRLAEEGQNIIYNDFMDHEDRCVWVCDRSGGLIAEIVRDEHGLDFIPWAAVMGGSELEYERRHQHHPLLYSVRSSGDWETQNIVLSLAMSEIIAKAAYPELAEEGPNPDNTVIDYGDPAKQAKVPPGNTLRSIPKNPIDRSLLEIQDRMAAKIGRSTVSHVLQGGQIPAGVAFSTLNLVTQTALGALKPAQDLAQRALSEILRLMIMWSIHTKIPLIGYDDDKKSLEFGRQIALDLDSIDEQDIYIDVELAPDVPTDRMQRANAASLMVQYGYPREYALEDLGVDDPQTAILRWTRERILQEKINARLQAETQLIMSQVQLAAQQAASAQGQVEAQMAAQMAQMAQQQQAKQMAQEIQRIGPFPGGVGFAPNLGGTPMAQAFPGMTREEVLGMDNAGNPLPSLDEEP